MSEIDIGNASPFFIVDNAVESAHYYRDKFGFDVRLLTPETEPFFAIVGRGQCQILLKAVGKEVGSLPNCERHEWASWDAFVYVSDPEALAHEFKSKRTAFHVQPSERDDGLYGFEVRDLDGYILFFGKPV